MLASRGGCPENKAAVKCNYYPIISGGAAFEGMDPLESLNHNSVINVVCSRRWGRRGPAQDRTDMVEAIKLSQAAR